MKFLSYITAFLVMAGATCFGQGMRISAYPNTNNLAGTNLFIVAIKGSPGTNMNISWEQLSNLFNTTVGGQYVLEQNGSATNLTILQQTNLGGIWFTNVPMPDSGQTGIQLHFNTNLLFSNGLAYIEMNTNGSFGVRHAAGSYGDNRFVFGPDVRVIVMNSITNYDGYYFTNVAMPYGGSSGMFMSANTNLIVTNGAGWMVVGSNGAVGVKTIPGSLFGLDVSGAFRASSSLNSGAEIIAGASSYISTAGRARLYSPDTNSWEVWNSTKGVAGDLRAGVIFATNGFQSFGTTNQFTGKVGIGTNNPQATFHAIGDGSSADLIRAGTTAADSQFIVKTNGNLVGSRLEFSDDRTMIRGSTDSAAVSNSQNYIRPGNGAIVCFGGSDSYPNKIGTTNWIPAAASGEDTNYWMNLTNMDYSPVSIGVASILGGYDHLNNQEAGTICGGGHNELRSGPGGTTGHSFIGGGSRNRIFDTDWGTIPGGIYNTMTNSDFGFLAGRYNTLIDSSGAIAMGMSNNLYSSLNTVACGLFNEIKTNDYSFIVGRQNTPQPDADYVFLVGYLNKAGAYGATLGGMYNIATNSYSSIVAGYKNTNYAQYAAILGGLENFIPEKDNPTGFLGNHSVVSGTYARARSWAGRNSASYKIAVQGDAQRGHYTLGRTIAVAGPSASTELRADASGRFIWLPTNSLWICQAHVVAANADASKYAVWRLEFGVRKTTAATAMSFLGTNRICLSVSGNSATNWNIIPFDRNDSSDRWLALQATSEEGETVYWHASLDTAELSTATPFGAASVGRRLSALVGDYTISGKVGIDTNAPAATLHVTGNNAQNVLQAGTSNKPSQLILSTNGVLSVNPGGGLNQLGCYGYIGMNDTNLIVCAGAASVYTNVAGQDGFTTITTNGFYGDIAANSAALTNLYAGWYKITVCLSALGENNQALEGEVFTNGVACDLIGFKKTYDAAARMDDMSMTGIIYLPASCRTDFRVQDGGTGGDVIVHRASLTVGTP